MISNKKLLEEINRFNMMSNYKPGHLINEQKYRLLKEETYTGIYEITWSETGGNGNDFQVGSSGRGGYLNQVIGTIEDDVLRLNDIGNLIFDKRKYPKTIEQVELLETQGKLRISNPINADYSKMSKKQVTQPEDTEDDGIKRRDVRRSKKMYKKKLEGLIEESDWLNGNSGSMIIQSKFPIAYNVGPRRGFLFFAADSNFDIAKGEGPKYVPAYSGDSIPGDTIDDFNVGENFKVYKDNMVQPNLVDLAKEQFDQIVKEFVDYINNGGFDKLTNVTIQGRADSANPTWDIPAGETSLDHSYGGIKRKSNYTDDELDQMNLYLARERAKNYKNKLIKEIKTQTGKEITIKELEPISYRGQQNRRGGQWRSILLVANAPTLEVINIDPIKKKEYEDYLKTKEEKDKELSSGLYPVEVGVGVLGDGIWLETSKGEQPFALSKTEPYPTGDFTTTSVFIRQDIIEEYKIPDYPNRAISTAKFEFNTESPKLSFIDGNGNTQNFDLYNWDSASTEGNSIARGHDNGTLGDIVNWLGSSRKIPGAGGGAYCTQKSATVVPFTVVSDSGRTVKYNGNIYSEVKNIWFAYASGECTNYPPKIDYYSVPEIDFVFR
jgi:hypothetical protein